MIDYIEDSINSYASDKLNFKKKKKVQLKSAVWKLSKIKLHDNGGQRASLVSYHSTEGNWEDSAYRRHSLICNSSDKCLNENTLETKLNKIEDNWNVKPSNLNGMLDSLARQRWSKV